MAKSIAAKSKTCLWPRLPNSRPSVNRTETTLFGTPNVATSIVLAARESAGVRVLGILTRVRNLLVAVLAIPPQQVQPESAFGMLPSAAFLPPVTPEWKRKAGNPQPNFPQSSTITANPMNSMMQSYWLIWLPAGPTETLRVRSRKGSISIFRVGECINVPHSPTCQNTSPPTI